MSTMGDTEFDATPVYSCCVDARTPGLHGYINRISNREIFERQPRWQKKIHQNQLKAHFKHLGLSTREYLTLNRKYSQGLTNHMHE